jgi:hypothetical protein
VLSLKLPPFLPKIHPFKGGVEGKKVSKKSLEKFHEALTFESPKFFEY